MKSRTIFFCFIACVLIDVLNKHLYLTFSDAHTSTKVYWTGQSISFLAYIVFIRLVAVKLYLTYKDRWTLLLKLAALNWIAFAVGDLADEVFGFYAHATFGEYIAFIITIGLTIREWKKHTTQKI